MRLLIVDDEPVIRQGLLKMVQKYVPVFEDIQMAENGQAALEKIRLSEPDIVMTDIRMPKMGGIELCKVLSQQSPRTMIVVISGHSEFEYAQKCINYGVKHYLLKPIVMSDVHEVMDKLLKNYNNAYLKVSRSIEWVDQMEQLIWNLRADELIELCQSFQDECVAMNLPLPQLKALLKDCTTVLIKRFQDRGFIVRSEVQPATVNNVQSIFEEFQFSLLHMLDVLRATRLGHFKDPMEEALTFINNRLTDEISLEQVADRMGLTPNYLSYLFKKNMKETFVQYKINKRIDKAKEYLEIPHMKIVDVALKVGYEDYPHFAKTFKKIVGVSPSEYRTELGIK